LDIAKVFRELFAEVIAGTSYLNAAKSLADASKSHAMIMRASPSFFALAARALLEAAQLCAARLFDTQGDSVGIPWLLRQAKHRREEFNFRTADDRNLAMAASEEICAAQEKVLAAIKHRRDRWLAHLDRRTIRDPEQFAKDAALTYPELEALFDGAAEILNMMADLCGQAGFLIFGDDYNDLPRTLALIEKGVEANARELEEKDKFPNTPKPVLFGG
jgi:hypothetical protein